MKFKLFRVLPHQQAGLHHNKEGDSVKTERQSQPWVSLYLLPLLKLQLDAGFDAVARVLVRLLQREFHEVLVVRSCQVPADENYYIRQYLGGLKKII